MTEVKPVESTETTNESEGGENLEVNRTAQEYAARLKQVSEEAKKHRLEAQEYKKKITAIETEKMKETGKWKELAEIKDKELGDMLRQREQDRNTYAQKVISGQIGQEALKLGCIDTKRLEILLPSLGIELEVDDSFNIKADSVKAALATAQKEMPYLFSKAAPKIKDAVPSKINGQGEMPSMTLHQKAILAAQKIVMKQ